MNKLSEEDVDFNQVPILVHEPLATMPVQPSKRNEQPTRPPPSLYCSSLYKHIVLEHMQIPHSIHEQFLDLGFVTWQA